ncbi:MAG TPA: hypothetical protein VFS40_00015 [Gemmatimonadales bacterium]|nr:hypothetical protein [Gemmatimonadales bacterium]
MRRSLTLLLATTVALAACSSDKPKTTPEGAEAAASTSSATSGGDDLADITNYRLSMAKVDQWYAAQRNIAQKLKAMSPAQRAAMDSALSMDASDPNAGLDDLANRIASQPMMRDAVKDAGLSPKEYATLTMSLVQSGMAAGVLKMRPKDNQDSLVREMKANPENVRFMQEHEAELNQKQQAMQAEMQKMGVKDE